LILGEEMEQNTVRWEKPSLLRVLRIILAISVGFCKEEVGVTALSQSYLFEACENCCCEKLR